MILCVTLNPALDRTLDVPAWRPGDDVRGRSIREVAGGKGNNVARAFGRLGRAARPVSFFGGPAGARCEALLRDDDGLDPIVTPIVGSTRSILTIRSEDQPPTAFFDPDPEVSPAEASELLNRVEGALSVGGVEAITLSGSSPSASTDEVFADLIAMARARRVPAFLDTYGPPLDAIWGFWPEAIHLNRREVGLHLRQDRPGPDALVGLLRGWAGHGVRLALITDGPGEVLALVDGRAFRARPPELVAVNPVGSGDSLLAGLADARLRGDGPEATLRHALACASANARTWDAGAIDPAGLLDDARAVSIEAI